MTVMIILLALIALVIWIIRAYGKTPTYTEEEQRERECTCDKAHSYECKCEEDNVLTRVKGYVADKNKGKV